jgi:hypothetical protein
MYAMPAQSYDVATNLVSEGVATIQIQINLDSTQLGQSISGENRAASQVSSRNFGQQWALHNTGQVITDPGTLAASVGIPGSDAQNAQAWGLRTDCSGLKIVVIDSGINPTVPELQDNVDTDQPGLYVPPTMLAISSQAGL